MKNIRHLMVASKGQAQPPIRQNNNKIYVTTTNITALPPKLPYDRTRKPRLTFSLSPCPQHSPSIFLSSSEKQFVLNKLPWLNKVCSLCPLSLTLSHPLSPSVCLSVFNFWKKIAEELYIV